MNKVKNAILVNILNSIILKYKNTNFIYTIHFVSIKVLFVAVFNNVMTKPGLHSEHGLHEIVLVPSV